MLITSKNTEMWGIRLTKKDIERMIKEGIQKNTPDKQFVKTS
jgi:hypothetical protein